MNHLHEVVDVCLTGRLCHTEELLFRSSLEDTQQKRMFSALESGEAKDDKTMRLLLYGSEKDSSKYRMLKKRLFDRLLAAVLLITPKLKLSSNYVKDEYYCHRNLTAGKLLLLTGARKVGAYVLHKVLERALRSEQYDIALIAANKLKQAAVFAAAKPNTINYFQIHDEVLKRYRADAVAERLYQEFLSEFVASRARKTSILDRLKASILRLEKLKRIYPTYYITIYHVRMECAYCELTGNYQRIVDIAKDYEFYLKSAQYIYTPMRHGNLLIFMIKALLQLERHDECINRIKQALELLPEDSESWFHIQEMHFLLLLNWQETHTAAHLYQQVVNNEYFQHNRPQVNEVWKIYAGYLWFLLQLEPNLHSLTRKVFKNDSFTISKLLNETPIFSQDKQGLHVSVLILQVLILLQRNDFDSLSGRIEALKVYAHRRIKNADDERLKIFIEMMLKLEQADYDALKVREKVAPLLEQLHNTPPFQNSDLQLEVIRYEKQWQLVLQMCG